jgi:hypothetical protein
VLRRQRHEHTKRTFKKRVNASARVKSCRRMVNNSSDGGMTGEDYWYVIIRQGRYNRRRTGIKDIPIGTMVTKVHCKHNGTVIAFFTSTRAKRVRMVMAWAYYSLYGTEKWRASGWRCRTMCVAGGNI